MGLPLQAMLTRDTGGTTPLHSLCTNSSVTPELLAAALEGLPSEAMLTKDNNGSTPLQWLSGNSAVTHKWLKGEWLLNFVASIKEFECFKDVEESSERR